MSNYTKSTNFATKDNLTPGDPLKIVRGTEIDTEFNNIATAIATKTDNASAAITGGTINDTTIGATTASTGAFTTISATGAITSTLATGTAPLVVASTTKVTNLNVDSLDGADWASPAALGSTTPAAVSATTLSASGNLTLSGGTANGVAYLNGSKVVTSGSALTFDGTNLATTGDISLGAGKLLKYSSTAYITPENNVSGAEISTTGVILFKAGSGAPEQMRLTSTGLGIGTSSPTQLLTVKKDQAAYTWSRIDNQSSSASAYSGVQLGAFGNTWGLAIGSSAANSNALTFLLDAGGANSEKMQLDTSGNLGLGVTPSAWSGIKAMQIGTAASFSGGSGFNDAFTASNAYYDGTNWKYINSNTAYYASVGGSAAARWYTAPSGTAGDAITFTQAMTLDASGTLFVGTTASGIGTGRVTSYNTGGATYAAIFANTSGSSASQPIVRSYHHASTGATSAIHYQFINQSATEVGTIACTGSATAYNTSSDYRLKNTIAPMTGALAKVALLKPCTYKWNADGSDGQGFIAHELAEVVPQAVTGEKDAVNEDGTPKYQGIDTSFLVATLTAAIQELKAEFDAYKASHP